MTPRTLPQGVSAEAAYGLPSDSDEADIVSHLFGLYAAKTRQPRHLPKFGTTEIMKTLGLKLTLGAEKSSPEKVDATAL